MILVDLQGHGRTADVDRPFDPETMADDVAGLIEHLGGTADVLGYSLGGEVALRLAIQHPERVRNLILVSVTCKRAGNHPEVLEAMDQMTPAIAEMLRQSPVYELYARIAPRPEDFDTMVAKTSDLLKVDYDWTAEVAEMTRSHAAGVRRRRLDPARRTSPSSSACSAAACATRAGTGRPSRRTGWRCCPAPRTTTSSTTRCWCRRCRASFSPACRSRGRGSAARCG